MKVDGVNYLTVGEFSKRARVSPSTVRRKIAAGEIESLRLRCLYCGRKKRCKRQSVCSRSVYVFDYMGLKVAVTM